MITAFPIRILVKQTYVRIKKGIHEPSYRWEEKFCKTPNDIPPGVDFKVLQINAEE